jgi:sodium pump decarboxylase gamma subunit
MLLDGLIIMAIGMGVVFLFLTLMVIVMNISANIFKLFPEEVQTESKINRVIEQNDEIAIVVAAVKAFG